MTDVGKLRDLTELVKNGEVEWVLLFKDDVPDVIRKRLDAAFKALALVESDALIIQRDSEGSWPEDVVEGIKAAVSSMSMVDRYEEELVALAVLDALQNARRTS